MLERITVDGVWCYRDQPGEERARLVGQLPQPRGEHVTVPVAGPSGTLDRLLVIGGSFAAANGMTGFHEDALLVPVDACDCSIDLGASESIPVPFDGWLLGHTANRLSDGTVLLVGGVTLTTGGGVTRALATGEAALFVPAVEW